MTFGAEATEEQSRAILDDYFAAGGNFIDTADVYSAGVSEEIIGRWLADRPDVRDRAVRGHQGPLSDGPGPQRRRDLPRGTWPGRWMTRCAGWAWSRSTSTRCTRGTRSLPWRRPCGSCTTPSASGKIAYYGFSNFLGWQLTKAVHVAKAHGWSAPVTLQPQYSLLVRDIESEIVPGLARRRHRPAAMVAAGRRLAVRQVQARPAARRGHPARRKPEARHGGLGGPQRRPAHLGRDR